MRRSYDVSEAMTVYLQPPLEVCPYCSTNLWVCDNRRRFVQRLDGLYYFVRQDKWCHLEQCEAFHETHRVPEDLRIALPKANYGTDVVVEVGERHMKDAVALARIGRDLNDRNVPVSQRHVGDLFRSYLALTKLALGDEEQIRQQLRKQGGILLMADGVQYDNTAPVLYLVWDALSGTPLFGERKAFRSKEDLVPLFERVKAMEVPLIGIVSDKEKGLVPAIVEVFPEAPHQLCQNHFLGNCAKGMSGDLKALTTSVESRATKAQKLAKSLHEKGWDSVEVDPSPSFGELLDEVENEHEADETIEEEEAEEPLVSDEEVEADEDEDEVEEDEADEPMPAEHDSETVDTLGVEGADLDPISEEQLAAEFCAMARHASRATGRAPLNPPERVRHELLESVREAVEKARKKGVPIEPSIASTRP